MIKTLFFKIFLKRRNPGYPVKVRTMPCNMHLLNRSIKKMFVQCSSGDIIPRETQKTIEKPVQPAYSMWIASEGQASTQVWQSTHISLSTFALSFSMAIADAGHSLTQVSHPVHLSLSTTATNSFTPVNMFILLVKKGLLLYYRILMCNVIEKVTGILI
jgi:hypothetical protein